VEALARSRATSFFSAVAKRYEGGGAASVVVTHVLGDRPLFVNALSRVAEVTAVLPKPKSVDSAAIAELRDLYRVATLDRRKCADATWLAEFLDSCAPGRRLVLVDIGGYFASALAEAEKRFSGELIGVVEDTENGVQKYERIGELPCPVIQVARSPLKNSEDFLVGQSIVFSTEAILREQGDILQGREACVIGYGKVGRSVAQLLQLRSVRTTVFDINPLPLTEAMAHGFRVAHSKEDALRGAGLVMCATGRLSLRRDDFAKLAPGAYVASVTSSDDELDLADVRSTYRRRYVTEYIDRFQSDSHHFYLLNNGNAVNFIHGAAVGPFILLVQAEILAGVSMISTSDLPNNIISVDETQRRAIADLWLDHFAGVTS